MVKHPVKGIWSYPNFFSASECLAHINMLAEKKLEPAPIMKAKCASRYNERVIFHDQSLADNLFSRLTMPVVDGYTPLKMDPTFRYYRYRKDHFIGPHGDVVLISKNDHRLYSFLVYLNEGFVGGETRFHGRDTYYDVVPMAGHALAFQNPIRHESKPIIDGVKLVLRGDLWYTATPSLHAP